MACSRYPEQMQVSGQVAHLKHEVMAMIDKLDTRGKAIGVVIVVTFLETKRLFFMLNGIKTNSASGGRRD
ncbi:hypothetical protein NYE67_09505 [Solibacillus sp. FSL W8-0474]|uniref:hypothetical protein n=1 Tax=Solibacillus sp. FSL W8-0474 TaxID=2975336 RepID=UPI0030FB8554